MFVLICVCESVNAFMMSMKVLCSCHLFMWGMIGFWPSVSMGSKGEVVVQSLSGGFKSPVIQMCLPEVMHVRDFISILCWKIDSGKQ